MENKPEVLSDAKASAMGRSARGGNEFYESRFDVSVVNPVSSRYMFFSSQRTGSNYLCRRLCNVNDRFGLPSEYLNPNAIKGMAARLGAPVAGDAQGLKLGEYLRGVERIRTTKDGCFGIKVQPKQVLTRLPPTNDSAARFLQKFERVIVLTRRDKVAQAVSGSIAEATGKWFSDGSEAVLADADLAKLCPDVAFKLNRYIQEEIMMVNAATRSGRPVLHIDYEEILAEPDATFNRLLVFLGEPRGVAGVEEADVAAVPEKAAGEIARRLKEQFLNFITGAGRHPVSGAGPASDQTSIHSRSKPL